MEVASREGKIINKSPQKSLDSQGPPPTLELSDDLDPWKGD